MYNFKLLAHDNQKAIAVIKADGYGHGAVEVAKYLEVNGKSIKALAVARLDEALVLRSYGIESDIILLSELVCEENIEKIISHKLIPIAFNLFSLKLLTRLNIEYIIKLDTGMNRLGFKFEQIDEIKKLIDKKYIYMTMTHLSVAESDTNFTSDQLALFDRLVELLDLKDIDKSISNSAASIRKIDNNISRIGIGMYGVNQIQNSSFKLKQTMTLESEIVDIKKVKKGEFVSYGNTVIQKDTKIAIVSIGYADGYNRNLSNTKAYALTRSGKIHILGKVCMDLTIFDIKDLGLDIGDKVLLFGENKFGKVDVEKLSNYANTISYEFFTNRSKRAKIRYIK